MSVTLKQRTYRDADGRACSEGLAARFLVGPEGARVSDETAISLGLVDGWLPDSAEGKERKDRQDKNYKGPQEDKTGRRSPNQGRPVGQPAPKKEDRGTRLKTVIQAMVSEAKAGGKNVLEKLFTREGKPDIRVISSRMEEQVSGVERDEVWVELESGAPHAGEEGAGSDPKAHPSPDDSEKPTGE